MSFDEVLGVFSGLAAKTDALAALGARLGLTDPGPVADPRVVAALDAVLAAAGIPDLDALAPQQRAMLGAGIRSFFRQSADLLDNPSRPPGWNYTDAMVLEGQGRASMMIPTLLHAAVPELAGITSFLDVGAGVGLLAIAAASVFTESSVVGIDPWEPALDRAVTNVREAGLEGKIVLRNQSVLDLDDVDAFDCAWVPTFFLPETSLPAALEKVCGAVRPGGWVVLGRYEPPPDELARATMALRTIRDGGCLLSSDQAVEHLVAIGCDAVRPVERTWAAPIGFVIGRKNEQPRAGDRSGRE